MTKEQIDQAAWTGNIGSRMPKDVIGLDIDAYKGGLDTFNGLLDRLGPLPPTWISHSGRNDQSGIRFYRVPIMVWVFNSARYRNHPARPPLRLLVPLDAS